MVAEYVTLMREEFVRRETTAPDPSLVFAESLPAFARILASPDGYLWVQRYATAAELLVTGPSEVAQDEWTVFDPEGRWLGTVATPAGLHLHAIGHDEILGVWKDSLDVEYVRLHRIVRPPPGA